jgi:hypothetical protein
MADDLTFTEKSVLMILMAEAREVPNVVLANQYRVKLATTSRDKLKRLGLITTRLESRRMYLELSDAGWKRCMEEFGTEVPERAGAGGAALYAMLGRIKSYLDASNVAYDKFFAPTEEIEPSAPTQAAVPATPAEIERRIREAYAALVPRPGDWVGLAGLRTELGPIKRQDVDRALIALSRLPEVKIVPESNQKTLKQADRDAAVSIGNQDRHLIAIQP